MMYGKGIKLSKGVGLIFQKIIRGNQKGGGFIFQKIIRGNQEWEVK